MDDLEKKTAQEVPVQEQYKGITININNLTFDSKFVDYLCKLLINYYQMSKKSDYHHH